MVERQLFPCCKEESPSANIDVYKATQEQLVAFLSDVSGAVTKILEGSAIGFRELKGKLIRNVLKSDLSDLT